MTRFVLFLLWLLPISMAGQIQGTIISEGLPLAGATVFLESLREGTLSQADGQFSLKDIPDGSYTLVISYVGFVPQKIKINHRKLTRLSPIDLLADDSLDEVVLSSQLREVNRLQSTIPVEVYAPSFLQKNPTPHGVGFFNLDRFKSSEARDSQPSQTNLNMNRCIHSFAVHLQIKDTT